MRSLRHKPADLQRVQIDEREKTPVDREHILAGKVPVAGAACRQLVDGLRERRQKIVNGVRPRLPVNEQLKKLLHVLLAAQVARYERVPGDHSRGAPLHVGQRGRRRNTVAAQVVRPITCW